MASYIALNYWELAAASVFVFMNAGLSVIFSLRVHRSLLVAAIRMVVQLALARISQRGKVHRDPGSEKIELH